MAAAHLQPDDVAAWLSTMSSAVPSQVLTNLKQDVTSRRLHGLRFSEILNECRTEDLRVEHLSPLHMARLRKAWNADFPETVDLRRAPPSPAVAQLQDLAQQEVVVPRQVASDDMPRYRFDSPQPPSPQKQLNHRGGFASHMEAPHAVLAALVVIVVDRLSCWAGLDMHTALSVLRDVLPPLVWEELSTVFLKHPPQAQVVDLLCHKARNMLAGEVALWQDSCGATRQPQVALWQDSSGAARQKQVPQSPASFEPPRRRYEVPVDAAPQFVANQRYVADEGWQESSVDTSRRNTTGEIGRRPPDNIADRRPPDNLADSSTTNRRGAGEGTLLMRTRESVADDIPIAVNNRRAMPEASAIPTTSNGDAPMSQGFASRQHMGARQPVPIVGAEHSSGSRDSHSASKRSSSRGPAMVAAWVRTLPSSQVPEKEREALACAVEAEGIDGEKFTKVAQALPMLATRGVPSPQHAVKVRKAWEQVLREDACRQIALESASASKVTQKAVKMVF